MSYSSKIFFTSDGSQNIYQVKFGYIKPEHVFVKVDEINVTFSWLDGGHVVLTNIPQSGAAIEIYRVTPKERMVNFTDGSFMIEEDLDLDGTQTLYIAEEAYDIAQMSIDDSTETKATADKALIIANQVAEDSAEALSVTSGMQDAVDSAAQAAQDAAAATAAVITLVEESSHAHANKDELDKIDDISSFALTSGTNIDVNAYKQLLGVDAIEDTLPALASTTGSNVDAAAFRSALAPRVVTSLAGITGGYVGDEVIRKSGAQADPDDDMYYWTGTLWRKVGV